MASSYPPPPPPPRSNDTILAVVIGIILVLALMAGFGVFAVHHFIANTRISDDHNGDQHHVEIRSPLGNLKVDGSGDNAKVDINSPFGSLKVRPEADLGSLGMAIYPGALQVTSTADSPFHNGQGLGALDSLHGMDQFNLRRGGSTSAHVQLASGAAALDINVAEFRTPDSPGQVLGYYSGLLGKLGPVTRKTHGDGAISLELKRSDRNVRAVAVKPGGDGTHFVLVRVQGGSAAK
ncbi:MAG TPA: hypothetical protein VMV31_00305 [Terriglobales bacterium]|nr:hypothetical protein [Terriglobales bacterium]